MGSLNRRVQIVQFFIDFLWASFARAIAQQGGFEFLVEPMVKSPKAPPPKDARFLCDSANFLARMRFFAPGCAGVWF